MCENLNDLHRGPQACFSGWGVGAWVLQFTRATGSKGKVLHKGITIEQRKQAICYSGVSVIRLMSSFIINFINIYRFSHVTMNCVIQMKSNSLLTLKEITMQYWETIKKAHEISQVMASLVTRKQNSFRVTQVKNSVYCKDAELLQNQRTWNQVQPSIRGDGEEQKQLSTTSISLSLATGSSFLSASCQLHLPFSAEQLPPFTHQLANGGQCFQFMGPSHHPLLAVLCLKSSSQGRIHSAPLISWCKVTQSQTSRKLTYWLHWGQVITSSIQP